MKMAIYQEGTKETNTTTTTTTTATTTTTTTTEEALELIAEAYMDSVGRRMPGIAREECMGFMDARMAPAVILLALDETAAAPRPSWAYCRAILSACAREGIRTAEDYRARNARWSGRRAESGRGNSYNPATDYSQREYKKEDYEKVFMNMEELGE